MAELDPKDFYRTLSPAQVRAVLDLDDHDRALAGTLPPPRTKTEMLKVYGPLPFGPLLGLLGIGRGLRPPATLSLGDHFRALATRPSPNPEPSPQGRARIALVPCKACGKEISPEAEACIHCG